MTFQHILRCNGAKADPALQDFPQILLDPVGSKNGFRDFYLQEDYNSRAAREKPRISQVNEIKRMKFAKKKS